tara:strand:- start:24 stop:257 length:234 start_codon:yes stop_codon:yes gene_type:complete
MNDITVFVYLVFFVALFGMTFAFMFKMMGSVLSDMDRKPVNSYGDAMRAYKPHPEMEDVKDGDELLVFKSLEDLEDK